MPNMMDKVQLETVTLGVDSSFLTHKPTGGGSGMLKNWKDDGKIQVWLHPAVDVLSVWTHPWWTEDTKREDGKGDDENPNSDIKWLSIRCFETEKRLKDRNKRDKDGERLVPPALCPYDFFLEWAYQQVSEGVIDILDPLLKFKVNDSEQVIYAGAATRLIDFSKEGGLSEAERRAITKKTGLTGDTIFKQQLGAKQGYLAAVVPHLDENSPCVIAPIAASLGQAIQRIISDKIEETEREWLYSKQPMSMTWKFFPEKSFREKYDAVFRSLDKHPMPAHVKAAFEDDPPSFDRFITPYNLARFRRELEEALDNAKVKAPVGSFFRAVEERYEIDTTKEEREEEDEPESKPSNVRGKTRDDEDDDDEPAPKKSGKGSKVSSKAREPEPEDDDTPEPDAPEPDEEPCEHCGKPLGPDDMICPHCGTEYVERPGPDGDPLLYMAFRPCANPDCMEKKVEVSYDAKGSICPQCGAEHNKQWVFTLPEPAEDAPPKRRRRAQESARARARRTAKG